MSINQNVYGTSSQWQDVHTYDNSIAAKDRVKAVYFGGTNYYDNNLRLGNSAGKTPINHAIDKSLSYCGLGVESAYSHFKYYDILDIQAATVGDTLQPFFTENRSITNFAFTCGNSNRPINQTFLNARNTTNGNNSRYAPTTGSIDNNTSRLSWFISYFAFNNFIALIYVHCFDGTFTDGLPTNPTTVTLNAYENDVSSVRTDNPFIFAVTIAPFTRYNAANDRIPMQWTADGHAIEILDSYNGGTSEIGSPFYTYGALQNDEDGELIIHGLVTGRGTASIQSGIAEPPEHTIFQIACIPDTWSVKLTKKNADYVNQQTVREYDETFYEETMRAVACFGLFFTDKLSIAQSGDLDNEEMYCGILEDGIGHGDYSHGQENKQQPQYNKSSNDIDYDPYHPPEVDPNLYNGKMQTHDLLTLGTATKRYNVNMINMELALLPKLWDIMALADPDENLTDYSLKTFLVNNPIDCIVSLQWLPVKEMYTGAATTIKLGRYDTQVSAYPAKNSIRYDCGNYKIWPREGNNWIDRQVQITLYLPFCGTVSLDPETYMDKSVNVEYLIDLTTGTCTAVVSFVGAGGERVITDTASGVCAIDLPVTGIQQQTLNSQLFNASESVKQLKVNNAFKGFSSIMGAVQNLNGNPSGAIGGILGATQDIYNIFQSEKIADYNLQHTQIPMKMIGTSGGITGAMCEIYPTIIFSRPTVDYDKDAYAHSNGFATCESGLLSGYSGYTEVINVDLSGFDATAAEKEMIKSLLASGVYL